MQTLFKIFLVLNLLAETLAATSLIGGPGGAAAALAGAGANTAMWSMHYGFAVVSIASAIFWIWPRQTSAAAVTPVLGMLMLFHIGVLISLSLEATQTVGIGIHSVLAVLAVILFTQRSKWCTD